MFQRILVPLDGFEHAERAIPIAARLARAAQGSIIFVCMIPPLDGRDPPPFDCEEALPPGNEEMRVEQAEHYLLHTLRIRYADLLAGIPHSVEIDRGAVAPGIFDAVRLRQADLIVMGSRGERGLKRRLFGTTVREAVRHSPVPVLVLNEHGVEIPEPPAGQPFRALVALDGSPLAETALEPAARLITALASPARATLHLLRIVHPPTPPGKFQRVINADARIQEEMKQEALAYLSALEKRLYPGLGAELYQPITASIVVSPFVAKTIIDMAERVRGSDEICMFQIIALSTHGRTGLSHVLMGSVAEQVVATSLQPVLVVRPGQQKGQTQPEQSDEKSSSNTQEPHLIPQFRGKSLTPMY